MSLLTRPLRRSSPAAPAAARGRRAPVRSALVTLAGWAVLVAVVVMMWPTALGGSSTLVRVAGDSMAPTYDTRDLLLARQHDSYAVGDVVVFDIPDGAGAGMRVVHRITRISDTFEGTTYTTRGDNRANEDQWAVTNDDVLGQVVYHVSGSGDIMAKVSDPAVIAIIGGVVVILLLLPARRSRGVARAGTPECSEKCPDACPGTDDETATPSSTSAAAPADRAPAGPETVDVSDGSGDGSSDYAVRGGDAPTSADRAR